ncbi:MAG TPA: hypothetical protein VFY71_08335 [Planctomycetota bacterium]|nr:hypothetical protein [Planctomycetota bacterium]
MSTRLVSLAMAGLLGACAADRPALADLTTSLAPLHAWFDAHAGHPRVILLLSPV